MNTSIFRSILAVIAAAGILLGSQWASAGQGPAPLYSGPAVEGEQRSVVLDGEGENTTRIFRVFYTRDTLEKVAAYYTGKMPKKTSSSPTKVEFNGPENTPLEYDAVTVWRPDSGLSEFDILDPLREEMGKEQGGVVNGHHTRDDLEAVKAKYGYLAEEAFFPDFSPKEKLEACKQKMGSGVDSAKQGQLSYQAKMQELASQGRFAEMQEYLSQAQNLTSNTMQAMSVSQWDVWTGCLSELEAKMFRAEILIRIK